MRRRAASRQAIGRQARVGLRPAQVLGHRRDFGGDGRADDERVGELADGRDRHQRGRRVDRQRIQQRQQRHRAARRQQYRCAVGRRVGGGQHRQRARVARQEAGFRTEVRAIVGSQVAHDGRDQAIGGRREHEAEDHASGRLCKRRRTIEQKACSDGAVQESDGQGALQETAAVNGIDEGHVSSSERMGGRGSPRRSTDGHPEGRRGAHSRDRCHGGIVRGFQSALVGTWPPGLNWSC